MAAGGGTSVKFPIKATQIGSIDVEVTATSRRAGDSIRKQMLVVVCCFFACIHVFSVVL